MGTRRGLQMSARSVGLLVLVSGLLLAACTLVQWGADGDVAKTVKPSENTSKETGVTYGFDTTEVDVAGVSHDPTVRVSGHLVGTTGKRELRVIVDDKEQVLATAGWHLPPVARTAPNGDIIACWSTLTGPEPGPEFAPAPADGVSTTCRFMRGGALGGPVLVPVDGSAWLSDIEVSGREARVVVHRTKNGVFGERAAGDGMYSARYLDMAFAKAELVKEIPAQ